MQVPAWQLLLPVQAFESLQVVPFDLGLHVPTVPVRLQALHCCSLHALLQQTPLTQKPVVHWLFEVQLRPSEGS